MTSAARPLRPAPALRPASVPTDLQVVRPRPRHASTRGVRPGMVLAIGMVVVFAALLGSAAIRSMLVSGQENLDVTRTQIRSEQQLLQSEKVQLAAAQSPIRIAAEAAALGMVATDDQRWLSLGPPTPPTPPAAEPVPETTTNPNELAAARP